MPYIDQSDILQRIAMKQLIQLTDDANTGQLDSGILGGVLEEASGKVDAYCRGRYATPLQQSDIATTIARDIAVYLLYSRRPQAMSETVRQRYEDAMAALKDIASGKAALDQPASAAAPQTSTTGSAMPSTDTRRFTDCNLAGLV